MLRLEHVSKSYPHESGAIHVLQDLTVNIQKGERVAILGPSGSGKSTLLAILGGLDRPSSGKVWLDNQDLGSLSEKKMTHIRAEMIGIVFQQFHLMPHLTAHENVALPLKILRKENPYEKASEALRQVGLSARLSHYPHELSGGECQRAAIARAMVTRPPLILADEPSGNLDPKTGDHVMKLLFDITEDTKTTLVLVTHNVILADWCDRKLLLKNGTLEETVG